MIERPGLVATPATVPDLVATPRADLESSTMIDIRVPVHNEEADLEASVRRLDAFVDDLQRRLGVCRAGGVLSCSRSRPAEAMDVSTDCRWHEFDRRLLPLAVVQAVG